MRLCLDLQGAQSESRHRGIGRYSLGFARALVARAGMHDVRVVLNGTLAEPIESLRAAFVDLLPSSSIAVFDTPGPVAAGDPSNAWRARVAERTREAFLAGLAPDVVHVSSVVEGWLDDAVTSIGAFDDSMPTAATLYDLIPLLREGDGYLANERYRAFYLDKLAHFKRAELLLAISDSARSEALAALALPGERVVAIGCGVDEQFFAPGSRSDGERLRKQFDIEHPYVFYVGGFDPRKNVSRLIEAYGRLGDALRRRFSLVIGGHVTGEERRSLGAIARSCGLSSDTPRFTGSLDDATLAALYRHAALFVFPSLHEGFGLPAAEAMASGAPVIASRTSSLPEVVGVADALFDPEDVDAICATMTRALSDDGFQAMLRRHGIDRARQFTWDACAARALPALEALHARKHAGTAKIRVAVVAQRPRLAYVSPLPPERTGIADYSAGLLPALADHYDIDVVVDQKAVADPWINANLRVRGIDWFNEHAQDFDRILYHTGNSPFHRRILEMASRHAGTVVMHDFFMTGMLRWIEEHADDPIALRRALYEAHGYTALRDDVAAGRDETCRRYPASLDVIDAAGGVIMHSRHAADLASEWFGAIAPDEVDVVPLYVSRRSGVARAAARASLAIPADAFLVCSFGFLAPTKLNHRLLYAWIASRLDADRDAWLVFVGENEGGEYGRRIVRTMAASQGRDRIRISGFVPADGFDSYLAAADVAVQLRTGSRGESSWAILRCLACGIPTITNAHGAAEEIPEDVVERLPDEFRDAKLASALLALRSEANLRDRMRDSALAYVDRNHAPDVVARRYRDAIERFAGSNGRLRERRLVEAIAAISPEIVSDDDLVPVAQAVARQRRRFGPAQLLIDVTVVARKDLRTGIERVVRGVMMELLRNPPAGFRVEPVRADGQGRYVYARGFALRALELPEALLPEDLVETCPGDVFLGLDWYADGLPRMAEHLADWRRRGVGIYFVVYDLLPVLLPDAFPASSKPMVEAWLRAIAEVADGAVCISRAVADELYDWLNTAQPARIRPLRIGHWPLGSTFADTMPTYGSTGDAGAEPGRVGTRPAFLMVGTVEPRKAHREIIDAFEVLWRTGVQVNLVIVGKQGWMMEALATRLRSHPELGRRLFWFEGITDDELERLYRASVALIAASRGEGFGLPLVEAARHGLPVIARDIPVFREVAGGHAHYFASDAAEPLAETIRKWLRLHRNKEMPDSRGIAILDWAQSTARMCSVLLAGDWYRSWRPQADQDERSSSRETRTNEASAECGALARPAA